MGLLAGFGFVLFYSLLGIPIARVADRLASPLGGQPAFVEGVAGLVQHAHERAVEIGFLVPRGEADIVGRAAAKRMGADIEPAMSEIEADPQMVVAVTVVILVAAIAVIAYMIISEESA